MVPQDLAPTHSKGHPTEHPQSEEEAILKAQQFDLIYAQSGYLYTIILDAPHLGTSYRDALGASHAVDGIIGSISHQPQYRSTPPTIIPQPSKTVSVSYQNQTLNYARMMSQSGATTSYAQPTPLQQAQALAWSTQQYAGQIPTFVAPPPTQIYYASLLQVVQAPTPTPPAPL